MIAGLLNRFFNGNQAVAHEDLQDLHDRTPLSRFLPYRVFDPETQIYVNLDETMGFLWECVPLTYAGEQTYSQLEALLNQDYPENTVMQFILYADPFITPLVTAYRALRARNQPLAQKAAEKTARFLLESTFGIDQLQGTPLRNFRLFVALKIPSVEGEERDYREIGDNVEEALRGIHLWPEPMAPQALIDWLARMCNAKAVPLDYNPDALINEQIVSSETPCTFRFDEATIGGNFWRCQTVKQMAPYVDALTYNFLNGDYQGTIGDQNQVVTPFLITVNVIFQNMGGQIHRKCNFVLRQRGIGSLATTLRDKQEEYSWAASELEKGERFVRVMPIVWHFAERAEQTKHSAARIKRMWERKKFVMQRDRGILPMLFLSALPFGLYTDKGTVDLINRDHVCHSASAAKSLPVQADFMGGGEPHCVFVGRKGQFIGLDLFFRGGNASNCFIAAETGSGKSFLVNSLAYSYHSSGAKVRIVDVGRSYRKLCDITAGNFIQFSKTSRIGLNPFSYVTDIKEFLESITAIVGQMIFSATDRQPTQTEQTLIKSAVLGAHTSYGNEAEIDTVFDRLANPSKNLIEQGCKLEEGVNLTFMDEVKKLSARLAFNLYNFTTKGEYGRWFNGPATLDIRSNDFVVLELEELKKQIELFRVVTLQVLDTVTSELYLSDRSRKTMIIFDEAWQFFRETGQTGEQTAVVIENGYRRARKYGGSFTTVVQSPLDLRMFGPVGQVIKSNSAYKFFLESGDYEEARAQNLIDYDQFMMGILKGVRNMKPRYSEIFMDTLFGCGVGRLVTDPFMYFISTSDALETSVLKALVTEKGLSYPDAIEHMIRHADLMRSAGYTQAEAFELIVQRAQEGQLIKPKQAA